MPYCPECGKEIDEGVEFCPECGASIQKEAEPTGGEAEPTGGVEVEDFLYSPPLIMAVAGVLMVIGSIGPWYTWGYLGASVNLGGSANGIRAAVAFMGLILLYSSAVDLGYIDILEEAVPTFPVSSVCGVVGLMGSIGALSSAFGSSWGLYLTIIASLIALYAAFRDYERK